MTWLITAGLTLPIFGAWVTTGIDTITDSRARKSVSIQSIAVDSRLTLHAAWVERLGVGPNYLLYSSKSPGSNWSVAETIAESVAVRVALTVEKNTGFAHIAFIQQFADTTELCYATNRTGTWQTIRITKDTICDFTPTIALESDSFAHIAWVTREPGIAFRIGYATNRTRTWETQILRLSQLGDFGSGALPYLALSPAGIAHITYRGGNYPDYHIHHAENTGPGDTSWSYEVLTTGNDYDYVSALAAQEGEELFLVASGNDGWGMPFRTHYLHRPAHSSNWDQYQLITASASASMEGFCMEKRNVHITWQLINGNLIMEQLYHCSNYTGIWFNSPIRADSHTTGGSIVVDSTACGHVLAIIETQSDTELYCIHSAPFTGITETDCHPLPARSLAPTFVKDQVSFTLTGDRTERVEIYGKNGVLVRIIKPKQNQVRWDCRAENGAQLATGIYFIRCGSQIGRVVLIK